MRTPGVSLFALRHCGCALSPLQRPNSNPPTPRPGGLDVEAARPRPRGRAWRATTLATYYLTTTKCTQQPRQLEQEDACFLPSSVAPLT